MKKQIIAHTNSKGQVVLPASMRKALNIDEHVSLVITLQGNTIQIEPIATVKSIGESSSDSMLEILRKTRGAWKTDSTEVDEIIRKRELAATVRRKNAW